MRTPISCRSLCWWLADCWLADWPFPSTLECAGWVKPGWCAPSSSTHLGDPLHHRVFQFRRAVQRRLAGDGVLDCPAGIRPGQPALVLLLRRTLGLRTVAGNIWPDRFRLLLEKRRRHWSRLVILGGCHPAGLHRRFGKDALAAGKHHTAVHPSDRDVPGRIVRKCKMAARVQTRESDVVVLAAIDRRGCCVFALQLCKQQQWPVLGPMGLVVHGCGGGAGSSLVRPHVEAVHWIVVSGYGPGGPPVDVRYCGGFSGHLHLRRFKHRGPGLRPRQLRPSQDFSGVGPSRIRRQ